MSLWDAARLNVYGVGLMAMWNTVNSILLPDRVDVTAPASLRGSALGLVSLIGIGAAAVIQPWAGQISDRAPLADRRRPFIAGGTIGAVLLLVAFGWAPDFWTLLAIYILLQVFANFSQAAFQALIPDLVAERDRGQASGVKNALSVVGAALGLIGARGALRIDDSGRLALVVLGLILGATAFLTYKWVPPVPPLRGNGRADSPADLLDPRGLWRTFTATLRRQPAFRAAVLTQFLFLLADYPVQRFLIYYLDDRFGDGASERASLGLAAGIVLGAISAALSGRLSDHLGRAPVLVASITTASIGLLGMALLPTLPLVGVAGVLVAIGTGAFQATNWALLSDNLPEGFGARALGVANVATAGAGALAGLFGPLIDHAGAVPHLDAYGVVFTLCAVIAALSWLPLRGLPRGDRSETPRAAEEA